jgi:hypothetical protein
MICESFDVEGFLQATNKIDPFDLVWVASEEALEVQRMLFRSKDSPDPKRQQWESYVEDLKSLISYIRYSAVSKSVRERFYPLLPLPGKWGDLPSAPENGPKVDNA